MLSVGIPAHVAFTRALPQWLRTGGIAAGGILALVLTGLFLSTGMSRGINRIRLAVQRVADGDLSPNIDVDASNLELARLQDAFSRMAANLRDTRNALDRQIEQERGMREALGSLQRQVVRQERLAAVGLLVSGVAHEMNNPLQAILGTAELLERRPDVGDDARDEIGFIKTQSSRAREIIRNLSRFGSQQSEPPALVDTRDVIAEAVQLRRRDLDVSSIALDVQAAATRKVLVNFTELQQVLLNFVINAQQSIEARGRARGRILIRTFDARDRVVLEVHDDGTGVPVADEAKLFQPFFTTKPVGQGMGLGLSVSYGIIDSYGGTIGHRTNEWGGATFYFELPAAGEPADGTAPDDRASLLHRFPPHGV